MGQASRVRTVLSLAASVIYLWLLGEPNNALQRNVITGAVVLAKDGVLAGRNERCARPLNSAVSCRYATQH